MSHATVLRPLVHADTAGVSTADHARLEFLAGYDGNTRAAYALDLRILFGWAATIGRDPLQLTRLDAALVALLGLMGLRVAEACGLDVADAAGVHADHRVLRFTGKGNKPAIAPIAPPVWRLLAPMLAGRVHGPLLVRPSGVGLNRIAAARIVNRLSAAAGIDRHITPHDLRRGYISGLLDAGVALRDAQQAARHSDPRMTARYDRARRNLDRHGNYALASWIAGAG